jgi:alanine racemase
MLYSNKLAEIIEGRFLTFSHDWPVELLLTDSRHAVPSLGTLFFAIAGKNHDGHDFLSELYQKGLRQFVVEKELPAFASDFPEANILIVKSALTSLQKVAAWHRNQFPLKIIGITGSNGKTIVKEWLYQLLSPNWSVVKSPKSYNSQIGVALSVWQIKPEHQIGIFEAGISRPSEMKNLADMIRPYIGIFTMIGPAHSEGFSSLKEKIEEKAALFLDSEIILYRKDYLEIEEVLQHLYPTKKRVSWSYAPGAGYWIKREQKKASSTEISIVPSKEGTEETENYSLPFTDDASLENLIHCILAAKLLGLHSEQIQERILHLSNIPMRLELKAGRQESYVIDDTYNNDPEGLRIALNFMQQQAVKKHKMVILSDMLESGIPSRILYAGLAKLLKEKQIDGLICVGPEISKYTHYFPDTTLFFPDTESFLSKISSLPLTNALILVKGARVFRFERIVQALVQKIHRTVLEINLNALSHNLNVFRQMVKPETKIMVMVKAFAYGAGSYEVAHLLQYQKVDYLAVAYTDEGIGLREHHIHIPIMVMNPSPDEFEKLIAYNLEPEIYSFRALNALLEFLTAHSSTVQGYPIHLAIDTGMRRLGFEEREAEQLCSLLEKNPQVKVVSVFSHLVGSDEAQFDDFSAHQASTFSRIAQQLEDRLGYNVVKHLLNSAGITRLLQHQFDMVRLGIGLYGIESEGHPKELALQAVGTLKTLVSQLHHVKEGESIGYSRKGKATRDSLIATIAIGYGDGFSRAFSNGVGKAWVKGRFVPVIGNVCMDMTMLDVTDVEVVEGDEVILFGEELPVVELAKSIHTIPYEILTNVSERVKRVFYVD